MDTPNVAINPESAGNHGLEVLPFQWVLRCVPAGPFEHFVATLLPKWATAVVILRP